MQAEVTKAVGGEVNRLVEPARLRFAVIHHNCPALATLSRSDPVLTAYYTRSATFSAETEQS